MESKEFYVSPEGETHVLSGRSDTLLRHEVKLVEHLYGVIRGCFGEAFARCQSYARVLCRQNAGLVMFHTVDRFVRCNFSNRDLHPDICAGRMELEDVPCHLRGVCPDERVICKPKCTLLKDNEERSIAELCLGFDYVEAGERACESASGIRHKWHAVAQRLSFKSRHELVRHFRGLHLERRLAVYG